MTKTDNSGVALRAFFNIAKEWDLTEEEQLLILGQPDQAVFDTWNRGEMSSVARDTLERISYVLGIFKAINTLLPDRRIAAEWVRKPNRAAIFGGCSAVDRMTAGNVSGLQLVRQYLDAEAPPLDESGNRMIGALKGQIWVADDFDDTPQWIIDVMEGR